MNRQDLLKKYEVKIIGTEAVKDWSTDYITTNLIAVKITIFEDEFTLYFRLESYENKEIIKLQSIYFIHVKARLEKIISKDELEEVINKIIIKSKAINLMRKEIKIFEEDSFFND